MFESLKKKLGGWFKKKDDEKIEEVEKPAEKSKDLDKELKKKEKELAELEKKKEKELKKISKEKPKKENKKPTKSESEKLSELEEQLEELNKEVVELKKNNEKSVPKVEEKIAEKSSKFSEEPVEELKEELNEEKSEGFFAKLKKKLSSSVLSQEDFDEIFMEFELTLLENNVALEVVDKIRENLGKDLVGVSVKKNDIEKTILESLKGAISGVLVEGKDILGEIEKSLEPYVILFFGINGAGKTTTIAKFAHKLKKKGISCVLGAGDTFRAASIEQLEMHANKVGVPIVKSDYGKDPAAVAFDAIQYARKNKIRAVLIDTAGRMYTQGNLMREMEKVVKVAKPNLKIFVGESITGNDATEQAKSFHESVGIDGIILSKADIDEKAGTVLSVGYVTGKPILFLGIGQGYDDLKEFRKEDILKGLGLD